MIIHTSMHMSYSSPDFKRFSRSNGFPSEMMRIYSSMSDLMAYTIWSSSFYQFTTLLSSKIRRFCFSLTLLDVVFLSHFFISTLYCLQPSLVLLSQYSVPIHKARYVKRNLLQNHSYLLNSWFILNSKCYSFFSDIYLLSSVTILIKYLRVTCHFAPLFLSLFS